MRTTEEIVKIIEHNAHTIIDNIAHESISVFNFLRTEFNKSNITENYLFQFVFRSFYRLDNAGLTSPFKIEYFNIMQEYRQLDHFDFATILYRLYNIINHKNQKTFQFSFVTKMQNTLYNQRPIFDKEVAKVFLFKKPKPNSMFNEKLEFYISQLSIIEQTYNSINSSNCLQNTQNLFDNRFPLNNLGIIKKLDFIFWSTGKLLKGESRASQKVQG